MSVRISDAEKTLGVGNGAGLFRIHADIDARGYQVGDGKHSENIQGKYDNEKRDAIIREQFGIKKRECRDESADECACQRSEDEAQNGEGADAFFGNLGRGEIVRRVGEAVFLRRTVGIRTFAGAESCAVAAGRRERVLLFVEVFDFHKIF